MWFHVFGFINYHWETFSSILKLVSIVLFCQTKKQTTESPFDKTRGLELLHSCFVKISVWEHTGSLSLQCLCLTQFNFSHISFIFAANPAFYFSCRLQFLSIHLCSHHFSWLYPYLLWNQSLLSEKTWCSVWGPQLLENKDPAWFQTILSRVSVLALWTRLGTLQNLSFSLLGQLLLHHLG